MSTNESALLHLAGAVNRLIAVVEVLAPTGDEERPTAPGGSVRGDLAAARAALVAMVKALGPVVDLNEQPPERRPQDDRLKIDKEREDYIDRMVRPPLIIPARQGRR